MRILCTVLGSSFTPSRAQSCINPTSTFPALLLSAPNSRWRAPVPGRRRDGLVFASEDIAMVALASWRLGNFHMANSLLDEATRANTNNLEAYRLWGDLFLEGVGYYWDFMVFLSDKVLSF